MVHWFHTKHQIPSTAATPGKMSSEGGRNPVINPIMFRTHSKKFYPHLTPLTSVEMEVPTKKCWYPLKSGIVHFGAHLNEGVPLHLGPKCG
ncbi:Uncharacterized protein APZ42_003716 [Daphnia magna]|uniref:Uncharacterized protein n=1 Tax=Daphnia magna TaxID=35525 RepID=A0A168EJW2_9CRUS|nr:Uncharacterized protein APZ42_003716 [Daphnia magna]